MDSALDRLLVEFGKEILKIVPGKVSTEVDAKFSFDTKTSVEKALHIIEVRLLPVPVNPGNILTRTPCLAVQVCWHRQVSNPHQDCLYLGRHPGRSDPAVEAWHQLQFDLDVFARPGDCGRRSWRFLDLALRWPNSGLVQGINEEGLRSARGPWGQERAGDLQLLQEIWLQDHRDGSQLPQQGRDPGTRRLRLPDHLGKQLPVPTDPPYDGKYSSADMWIA